MRITSNGRVGIGATPANVNSKLEVWSSETAGIARFYSNVSPQFPQLVISGSTEGSHINHTWSTGAPNLMFSIAGNEAFRLDSSRRMGIGTTTPDANLTVQGQSSFNTGSLTNPGIAARGDLNTGMYFPSADTIGFVEGGVEAMRIDSSGNVGIGTTSPTQRLTVSGSVSGSGNLNIGGNATIVGDVIVNTNTLIVSASSNRVGIGTTSPTATLTVSGSSNVTGSFAVTGSITENGSPVVVQTDIGTADNQIPLNQYLGTMAFQDATSILVDAATISGQLNVTGGITGSLLGTSSFAASASYAANADLLDGLNSTVFATTGSNTFVGNQTISGSTIIRDNLTVNTNTLIVSASSNRVGIGTTSPTATLTVSGSSNVTGSLDVTGAFTAQTKSFKIPHQTQVGKSLVYGVLEGREHSVYARGKLNGNDTIELPDEWTWLIDEDSITVQLTPIGSHQKLYVQSIYGNKIVIKNDNLFSTTIHCYYIVHATRKDVDPLITVV
jgi:hypothetical protein